MAPFNRDCGFSVGPINKLVSDMVHESLEQEDPVTLWIDQLRSENDLAAHKLWHHFVHRLQDSARSKLMRSTRRVYDEEDAAQSAFHSVCAGISAGRFPELNDREGLLHLLLVITSRKVSQRIRYDNRKRRDVRRVTTDSIFAKSSEETMLPRCESAQSREPTPEFAIEFVDVCETLFKSLDDPQLKQVALLRIEGFTDEEIAERLTCSRRTVQRRLEVIRRHWENLDLDNE